MENVCSPKKMEKMERDPQLYAIENRTPVHVHPCVGRCNDRRWRKVVFFCTVGKGDDNEKEQMKYYNMNGRASLGIRRVLKNY
jgi:hypothetical protein